MGPAHVDLAIDDQADIDAVLVAFSAMDTAAGSFTWFAQTRGLARVRVMVNCPANSWYLGPIPGLGEDWHACAEAIAALIRPHRGPGVRTVFFGSSMGAFGALLYGAVVGPDATLAIAPEVRLGIAGGVAQRHMGGDRSWLGQDSVRELLSIDRGTVDLVAGEDCPPDVLSLMAYPERDGRSRVRRWLVRDGHHQVAVNLAQAGDVRTMLRRAASGVDAVDASLANQVIDDMPRPMAVERLHAMVTGPGPADETVAAQWWAELRHGDVLTRAWAARQLLPLALDRRWLDLAEDAACHGDQLGCDTVVWHAHRALLESSRGDRSAGRLHLTRLLDRPRWHFGDVENAIWFSVCGALGLEIEPSQAPTLPAWAQARASRLAHSLASLAN